MNYKGALNVVRNDRNKDINDRDEINWKYLISIIISMLAVLLLYQQSPTVLVEKAAIS